MMESRILVIQTAFLGDAILTLPMIQKLKDLYPDSVLDVVAIPSTVQIFQASPCVNQVLILDKKGTQKSIFSLLKFAHSLRKKRYNVLYSPHRSFRTAFLVMLLNIRESYGFDNSEFKYVFKNLINYRTDYHEVQRNLNLIGAAAQYDNWKILPVIKFPPNIEGKIEDMLHSNHQGKIAAIAPGSVWNTKQYPQEYFAEIIDFLLLRNFYVFLIGSRDEIDLCEIIKMRFSSGVTNLSGSLSVIESIRLLKSCSILICNDSAPTHMGMCADIPTVTIYCSTVAEFGFYPYNDKSIYLSFNDLSCKPCGIHGHRECPIKTFECGFKLTPENVIEKITEILK